MVAIIPSSVESPSRPLLFIILALSIISLDFIESPIILVSFSSPVSLLKWRYNPALWILRTHDILLDTLSGFPLISWEWVSLPLLRTDPYLWALKITDYQPLCDFDSFSSLLIYIFSRQYALVGKKNQLLKISILNTGLFLRLKYVSELPGWAC